MIQLWGNIQLSQLKPLFSYSEETLIQSCLQGHMGSAWADRVQHPRCAQILIGDFAFYAGDPAVPAAQELVRNIPGWFNRPFLTMIPENELWGDLIERQYNGMYKKLERYAIRKEPGCFCIPKLKSCLESLPEGYVLQRFDREIYRQAVAADWSRDFCAQFDSVEDYINRGIGYAILHREELVCGASSYSIYDEGIEIEIATKLEHRRRGLAAVCAAALILDCLEQGLYPSWDAANMESVKLAEKLGYSYKEAYTTYAVPVPVHSL